MKNPRKVKDVEFLSVRLSPQKYAELKVRAASQGLSASAYSRQAIFEKLAQQPQHQQQAA